MAESALWELGGKAAMLQRLQRAGFRVPPFVMAPPGDLPDDRQLESIAEQLGYPLAVRSSAACEDGPTTSFAGQFTSFLDLRTPAEVRRAVARCRQAVNAPELQDYCRRMRIDPTHLRMNVMIQKMVQPVLAGVAFGVDPSSGEDRVVIEACEGLADELLAGRREPLAEDHPLVLRYRDSIASLVREVQALLGQPQDIEFAVQDNDLYLLQARPITRIQFPHDIGDWTNADFRDGGVSADVCSPLMWSLYELAWDLSLKQCLREIRLYTKDFQAGRMFFGRPYWNLAAVKNAVARIPGFVERDFDNDLSVAIDYNGPGRTTPVSFRTLLRAVPTLLALPGFFRRRQQEAEALLREFPTLQDAIDADWRQRSWRQLIEHDYVRVEATYFRTIYAVSLAKMDFQDSFPDCNYARLAAALPDLQHMAPSRVMRTMHDQQQFDIDILVRQFRHHCRFGIDVRRPRWDEDREFVQQLMMRSPAAAPNDPATEYLAYREECRTRLPRRKQRKFDRKLDRLRAFVWLREELRDVSNRMYYAIRRKALHLSQQRGLGDDIFFQTYQEIIADERKNIDARRRVFDTYRNFAAPNEIRGQSASGDAQSALMTRQAIPRTKGQETSAIYRGIAASGGVAVGRVHVARDVQEAMEARAGDILVCPFTEPGWTPVLDRVAAVVTETGGQLSHAAVICREYGIPAVLGVAEATRTMATGIELEVDGYRGTVTRR